MVTDSHPVVSCCWRRGFYRPRGRLKVMFDQLLFCGWMKRCFSRGKEDEEAGESPGNEEPCWLLRRAGFSKIDDLCQIVNYLLASLVRSSFVLRCAFAGWTHASVANPNPGFPMRTDIPPQCDHAGACEAIGYVGSDFIGF